MEPDETGISVVCSRLVVPTEIDSPSMFHPTLICSSTSYYLPPPSLKPSSSSASSVPAFLRYSGAQVERETSMEEATKSSLGKESSLHQQLLLHHRNKAALSEDSGGYTERWGLSGEGFSVDELLNLGDYVGSDKDAEAAKPFEAENTGRSDSESNSSLSSAVSGLSFQPPAPPPPEPSPCDINLPAHDAAELEWVSFIIDDSHSGYTQTSGAGSFPRSPLPHSHEETTNPAAAAAQGGRPMETAAPSKAKRSKRLRSAVLSTTWFMSCSLLLAGSASSTTTTTTTTTATTSSYSSDTSDACLIYEHPPTAAGDESFLLYDASPQRPAPATKQAQAPPKKRGRKPKHLAAGAGERRCSHCGAQKTPQWRAGPLGAKTLCNACGVRFKSGRLLPEYRPACSPTFVSHVHSNSHRKVLEMRRKKEVELALPAAALPVGTRIG